jgi:hypothetical protein
MPMNFSIKSSNQIVKAHCAPRIILGYSSVLLSGFATASHDSRPAFPSASTSPCESTNGVSMNGTSAAGTPNSSWRPIKSNSASCSGVTTTSAGAPCLEGTVRRRHEQGHGEPGLAQGEGRLGRLECSFAGRRAGCAAYSRWHGGRRAARPQGNRNLAAGRPWRADGQKVLLAVKAMGGESSDAWRSVLD